MTHWRHGCDKLEITCAEVICVITGTQSVVLTNQYGRKQEAELTNGVPNDYLIVGRNQH